MSGPLRRDNRAASREAAASAVPDAEVVEAEPAVTTQDAVAEPAEPVSEDRAEAVSEDRAEEGVDAAPETGPIVQWAPAAPIRKGYGGSALSFALAGLATSFFVGWAFPLALIGIALGIVAACKREESSRLAAWSICLGTLALIYSAGWLWFAGDQLHWFS